MTISELDKQIDRILESAETTIVSAETLDALRRVEAGLLGKKGSLSRLLGQIGRFDKADRAAAGQRLNQTKKAIGERLAARRAELETSAQRADRAEAATYDPTIPSANMARGGVHPVTAVQWEAEDILGRLGFVVVGGPEMETDYYNFEALNIPAMHPARDMQDTFWLDNGRLLRTHTSPCQVRAMERLGAPLRVIAPGRCFRYETLDASHENTFFQLEGLMIDRHISIANLIAVMKLLLREVFHREVDIRLRPGYFPFVEPGFELDMSCAICGGSGCATCKQSGWIEILPCGMVHPNVLRFGKIDPHEFTGFAFGLGLTRLAMMKYGVSDIRVLNGGDLRAIAMPDRLYGPAIVDKTGNVPGSLTC